MSLDIYTWGNTVNAVSILFCYWNLFQYRLCFHCLHVLKVETCSSTNYNDELHIFTSLADNATTFPLSLPSSNLFETFYINMPVYGNTVVAVDSN